MMYELLAHVYDALVKDDEATAYIFKDVSEDDSQEACYEMVEDEDEMQAVFKVFEQMLDDVDLEM